MRWKGLLRRIRNYSAGALFIGRRISIIFDYKGQESGYILYSTICEKLQGTNNFVVPLYYRVYKQHASSIIFYLTASNILSRFTVDNGHTYMAYGLLNAILQLLRMLMGPYSIVTHSSLQRRLAIKKMLTIYGLYFQQIESLRV